MQTYILQKRKYKKREVGYEESVHTKVLLISILNTLIKKIKKYILIVKIMKNIKIINIIILHLLIKIIFF